MSVLLVSVGWCHSVIKGRKITLACSYRSTCLDQQEVVAINRAEGSGLEPSRTGQGSERQVLLGPMGL